MARCHYVPVAKTVFTLSVVYAAAVNVVGEGAYYSASNTSVITDNILVTLYLVLLTLLTMFDCVTLSRHSVV